MEEGASLAALRKLAATGSVSPTPVLVAAFELYFPEHPARVRPDWPACLSASRAAQLDRAVLRYDRHHGAGTGLQRLLTLVEEHDPLGFRGVLKRLGAPVFVVTSPGVYGGWWQYGTADRHSHAGPVPVSAAFFVQKLHRESKIAATRARGGLTYDQLNERDPSWRDRDETGDGGARPGRALRRGQLSQIEKLVRKAEGGDDTAQRELVRLINAARREDAC